MRTRPKVIVIAGPTASGKSALALAAAAALDGVLINADSQQCYGVLPILTACPTAADVARVPHRLFGELGPLDKDSAPTWAARAAAAIADTVTRGRVPIVVGGSGLYLQALMTGIPVMPAVAPEIRDAARALLEEIGHSAFHERLAERDPIGAARLKPGDTQRLLRAWEVVEASGRPLSAWQEDAPQTFLKADYHTVLLMPPRKDLVAACETRLGAMIAAGAVDEVRGLLDQNIPPTAPIMRVLGARPLARYLVGEIDLATAATLAKTATRQYAKRQATWFKHQFLADQTIFTKYSVSLCDEIFAKIRRFLLT